MCVLIVSTSFVRNISYYRSVCQDIIKNVDRPSGKVHIILVIFEGILKFLYRFSKNPQISDCMKIRPVDAPLLHAYRRMGGRNTTKLVIPFGNFAKEIKNN